MRVKKDILAESEKKGSEEGKEVFPFLFV